MSAKTRLGIKQGKPAVHDPYIRIGRTLNEFIDADQEFAVIHGRIPVIAGIPPCTPHWRHRQ